MGDNIEKAKILVTGVAGQLGQEVFALLGEDYQVLGTAHTVPHRESSINLVAMDLASVRDIESVVRGFSPQIIVNCGAYTAVDRAESEEPIAMQVNGFGPQTLAIEAKKLGALLIHISTDYVFDGSSTRYQHEDDSPNPINQYGKTKLAGEQLIAEVGCAYVVLRTSWVYGASGSNFLNTMLRLGSERETLGVVSDQIGAPTTVQEISKGIQAVIRKFNRSPDEFLAKDLGIYHLVCGGETSWHGFATEIFSEARKRNLPLQVRTVNPIATAEYKTPAQRPLNSRLNCDKMASHFGYRAADWKTALVEVLRKTATKGGLT